MQFEPIVILDDKHCYLAVHQDGEVVIQMYHGSTAEGKTLNTTEAARLRDALNTILNQ